MEQLQILLKDFIPSIIPILIFLSIFVEISPVKINPWTWFGHKIGSIILEDTNKRIDNIEKKVDNIKEEAESATVASMRWNILDFANSCRNERKHTRSEWDHVITQIDSYNIYVEAHNIKNGVIESEEAYLKDLFKKRLVKNDFL